MTVFRPNIPPHVAAYIRHLPPDVKRGVRQALRALSLAPEAGEPLRRELEELWKYRVRRFRIVYTIDYMHRILRIVAVGHRRGISDEVAEYLRRPEPSGEQ
jgi:mRNA interferase RelE/StbE